VPTARISTRRQGDNRFSPSDHPPAALFRLQTAGFRPQASGFRLQALSFSAVRPSILLDEPKPLGLGRGPSAAAVLGSAIGNCLAASLAFCLRKSHADVAGLTARVATHITRTEKGRLRISSIDVTLMPELADVDRGRLARCRELFEDSCVVAESVRNGIPVNVAVEAPVAD
jgi:uncharacterized OsmC-like protein